MRRFTILVALMGALTLPSASVQGATVTKTFTHPTVSGLQLDAQTNVTVGSVTFGAGDFGSGDTVGSLSVQTIWTKTGGTCPTPVGTDAYHNETAMRIVGPTGTSRSLIGLGSYTGGGDIGTITTTFVDGAAGSVGGSNPVSGTFTASGGSLNTFFGGLSAQGTWTLQATDSVGGDPLCVFGFSVTVTSNSAPLANAGGPYTVNQGVALTMNGSSSSDPGGSISLYEWDCTDDGVYDVSSTSPTGASCTYADNGSNTLRLRVTDNASGTATSTAAVTVTNTTPTANAGGPYTVALFGSVTFNGGSSSDPDGSIVLYEWDCTANGTFDVSSSSATGASCTYVVPGAPTVRLRVTDDDGATNTATTTVTVLNAAPTADAGGPYNGFQGIAIGLDGSGSSDVDGTIATYAWDCTSNGSIDATSSNPTASSCTFSSTGTFTVTLLVTDNAGATGSATTTAIVVNQSPLSDAGGPYTSGIPGVPMPLDGSASFDPDGSISLYEWDCTDDGSYDVSASTPSGNTCTYAAGGYIVRLRVTDDDGATDEDTASVGVGTRTVLFVADDLADTNIPTVLRGDGHTVVDYTDQYVSATRATTPLTWDLDVFDVVVWSATGTGLGGLNDDAAMLANLEAYVSGGGHVFVTGYDSLADPTDAALAVFVGGTGSVSDRSGSASNTTLGPVINASNMLTTGVVDIRGVTPTGGHTDMDGLVGVASGTTVVTSFTSNASTAWSLRPLGVGTIAYVSNGASGTSAHASWANTSAGGPGAFNAALRNFVANSFGAVPNAAPLANAGGPYTINQGSTIALDGTGSGDVDGVIISYAWDCEDDGVINVVSALATGETCLYTDDGIFFVRLTVTDQVGVARSATSQVTVTNTLPVAVPNGPYAVGQGQTLAMNGSGSSDADGSVVFYEWDCTDNGSYDASSSSATGAVCFFPNAGSFSTRLRVTDDDGGRGSATVAVTVSNTAPTASTGGPYTVNQGIPLSIDGSASNDADGTIVNFEWDCLNDGTFEFARLAPTGDVCMYPQVGSYTLALRVTDDDAVMVVATTAVTVTNTNPIADANGPYAGTKNFPITVLATGSVDGDGAIVQYAWDCANDGVFEVLGSTTVNTCTYPAVGSYTATLRVTDDDGGVGLASTAVTVGNDLPVAAAGTPYTVNEGVALALVGSSSSDPGGAIVSYAWDCTNNGSFEATSSVATGSFCTYGDNGTFTLRLRVTDNDGATNDSTTPVTVVNLNPVIASRVIPSGAEGATLTFSAVASDVAADPLTLTWNFGDGTTGTGTPITHVFGDDGAHSVVLTVTDGDAGSATSAGTSTITNVAPAHVSAGPATALEGEVLSFSVSESDAGALDVPDLVTTWGWGDGTAADTGVAPTHAFADQGEYVVTITTDDQDLGVFTTTRAVSVANVAPEIVSNPPVNAVQGSLYSYLPTVVDPGDEVFSWTLAPVSPAGMTQDPSTGLLSWTPTYAQSLVGAYVVVISVDDGDGASDAQSYTVNVGSADVDGDGMADDWELDNGLDPSDPGDSGHDYDLDGLTNVQEFTLDQDPAFYDGPDAPTLLFPILAEPVADDRPDLLVTDAVDPQNDVLTYTFSVYADSALSSLVTTVSGIAAGGAGTSTWKTDLPLAENTEYWWRVSASDPYVAGAWSSIESFVVNLVEELPGVATPVYPIAGETVSTLLPTLLWTEAQDPDLDVLTYEIELVDAAETPVQTATDVSGDGVEAEWTLSSPLVEDTVYGWRVRAWDDTGRVGPYSELEWFVVNEDNEAPSATAFTAPLDGAIVASQSPDLRASEASDPEGGALEYLFEVDTSSGFDTADYESALVPETGNGTVTWDLAEAAVVLPENVTIYARVRAIDEGDVSSIPDTISFFVRGQNEAPNVPELLLPEDGAVGGGTPRFAVSGPVDPEGDVVYLDFVVARDLELEDVLLVVEGVIVSAAGIDTELLVDTVFSGDLYWSARAVDVSGAASEWAQPFLYRVRAGLGDDDDAGDDDDDGQTRGGGCPECGTTIGAGGSPSFLALLLLALPLLARRRR